MAPMANTTELSFCETVTAGPRTPWHIRRRNHDEPLKPGGGLFVEALCGRDLRGGWDLPNAAVTDEAIARLNVDVCAGCVSKLRQS